MRRQRVPLPFLAASSLLIALLASPPAAAVLIVEATVTPASGAFDYLITVDNQLSDDVVFVSLVGAPLGDALLAGTLVAPVGYLASYDAGLGIVDLLEGTELFAAASVVSGFAFTSLAAPGPGRFEDFEALTANGDFVSGTLSVTIVPEPRLAALVALGLAGIGAVRRRDALRLSARA